MNSEEYDDLKKSHTRVLEALQIITDILNGMYKAQREQERRLTGPAAFWNGLFSIWGAIIVSNTVIWPTVLVLINR